MAGLYTTLSYVEFSAVHREGRVGSSRNLPRYLTVGENGPKLYGVSVRVFGESFGKCFPEEKKEGTNRGEAEAVYQ